MTQVMEKKHTNGHVECLIRKIQISSLLPHHVRVIPCPKPKYIHEHKIYPKQKYIYGHETYPKQKQIHGHKIYHVLAKISTITTATMPPTTA